jgi:acyl-CoA reductase-like NAD-dependent aldehyde dehydrogenase
MTTHVDDVMTGVGLLIGGAVVAGDGGTYPVTNPARPAEVVLRAPATSPEQLDGAVDAARRSQPAWAALGAEERAATVIAPALPVLPYDDIGAAVDAANDTGFGLCASVWSNDDALAADVASHLSAGTVFVNTHGIAAIDMYAPMGGWKQSGFGVELGTEGMQAFARQRVQVHRPAPAEQGGLS